MPTQDSKLFQLSFKDIRSWIVYALITAVSLGVPILPDIQAYLISLGYNPLIVGYFIAIVSMLLKKFLTDYSK